MIRKVEEHSTESMSGSAEYIYPPNLASWSKLQVLSTWWLSTWERGSKTVFVDFRCPPPVRHQECCFGSEERIAQVTTATTSYIFVSAATGEESGIVEHECTRAQTQNAGLYVSGLRHDQQTMYHRGEHELGSGDKV